MTMWELNKKYEVDDIVAANNLCSYLTGSMDKDIDAIVAWICLSNTFTGSLRNI